MMKDKKIYLSLLWFMIFAISLFLYGVFLHSLVFRITGVLAGIYVITYAIRAWLRGHVIIFLIVYIILFLSAIYALRYITIVNNKEFLEAIGAKEVEGSHILSIYVGIGYAIVLSLCSMPIRDLLKEIIQRNSRERIIRKENHTK